MTRGVELKVLRRVSGDLVIGNLSEFTRQFFYSTHCQSLSFPFKIRCFGRHTSLFPSKSPRNIRALLVARLVVNSLFRLIPRFFFLILRQRLFIRYIQLTLLVIQQVALATKLLLLLHVALWVLLGNVKVLIIIVLPHERIDVVGLVNDGSSSGQRLLLLSLVHFIFIFRCAFRY